PGRFVRLPERISRGFSLPCPNPPAATPTDSLTRSRLILLTGVNPQGGTPAGPGRLVRGQGHAARRVYRSCAASSPARFPGCGGTGDAGGPADPGRAAHGGRGGKLGRSTASPAPSVHAQGRHGGGGRADPRRVLPPGERAGRGGSAQVCPPRPVRGGRLEGGRLPRADREGAGPTPRRVGLPVRLGERGRHGCGVTGTAGRPARPLLDGLP